MTSRRPLVLKNGRVQELEEGDDLLGSSASSSLVLKYNISGDLEVAQGTLRWYPDKTVTLHKLYFSMGLSPTSKVRLVVKKNGTSILGASELACLSGSYKSNTLVVDVSLSESDYLTVDVLDAFGSDAVLCIVYS